MTRTPTLYSLDRKNSAHQSLQGILRDLHRCYPGPLWVSSAYRSVYITSVTKSSHVTDYSSSLL
eukprot:440780-Rhodomonas_salina.3